MKLVTEGGRDEPCRDGGREPCCEVGREAFSRREGGREPCCEAGREPCCDAGRDEYGLVMLTMLFLAVPLGELTTAAASSRTR